MGSLRLLACFAHPDDEAFSVGGALALSASRGIDTRLVCATLGEEGEIRQAGSATAETLPQVRQAELRCSCKSLGLQEPVVLGYRDSGMRGTEANEHPQAFINAPADQVVERLVQQIRHFRPQVVLTFGDDGLYGHPDHVAISRHTTTAFGLAGNGQAFPHQLQNGIVPFSPSRLFYSARPRGFRMQMALRYREAGIDMPLPPPERQDDGIAPENIHMVLDVSGYLDQKLASLRCHFTQLRPESPYWSAPHDVVAETIGVEHYVQGYPVVERGTAVPADFFHGL